MEASSSNCATPARSSQTSTCGGSWPLSMVSWPWPVRTSQVRQPAARPARTSAGSVADHRRLRRHRAEAIDQLEQHARLRLAAAAVLLGTVRADGDRVDAAAGGLDQPAHPLVDRVEHRHVEQAAGNGRLVGGDRDEVAAMVQAGDRFQAARQRLELLRPEDVAFDGAVDDTLAIENDQFHQRRLSGCRHRGRRLRFIVWRDPPPGSSGGGDRAAGRAGWRAAAAPAH